LGDRVSERRITSRPIFPDSGISNIPNSVYYTLGEKRITPYKEDRDYKKKYSVPQSTIPTLV
jgi:hypothetical protein